MKSHAGDNPDLCVTKNSSPKTTHIDTIKVMLWIIHIYILFVALNSSPSTTVLFNIQELMQDIFRFGNIMGRQKTHGNTLQQKACNTQLFAAGENW